MIYHSCVKYVQKFTFFLKVFVVAVNNTIFHTSLHVYVEDSPTKTIYIYKALYGHMNTHIHT